MATLDGDEIDPWHVRDIWAPNTLPTYFIAGEHNSFPDIDFNILELQIQDQDKASRSREYEFELPPLEELGFGSLQWHDSDSSSVCNDENTTPHMPSSPASADERNQEKTGGLNDLIDDIWQLELSYDTEIKGPQLLTWEHFSNPSHLEPSAAFLSEAGPDAFDAALNIHAEASKDGLKAGRAVQSSPFLNSLCQLGLGRASVLFTFDAAIGTFSRAISDARLPGCSMAASDSVVQQFLDLGHTMVELKLFEEKVYTKRDVVPAVVALANVAASTRRAVEVFVMQGQNGVKSILQLQALFEPVKRLLFTVQNAIRAADGVKSNADVVNVIFRMAQHLENSGSAWEVLLAVLERVSGPWFEEVEALVGMRQTAGAGITDASGIALKSMSDMSLLTQGSHHRDSLLPDCVGVEEKHLIAETITCMDFLRRTYPDHPLCTNLARSSLTPVLGWAFTLEDVDRVSRKAAAFEAELKATMEAFELGKDPRPAKQAEGVVSSTDNDAYESSIWLCLGEPSVLETSIVVLNAAPSLSLLNMPDELFDLMARYLRTSDLSSTTLKSYLPLHMMPRVSLNSSIKPLHTHLTRSALRSVLYTQDLNLHFTIMHDFFLFASGSFISRLSSVLFDPALSSAERQRGVLRADIGGGLGLRLGSGERREWPPTSSELMLALRGVLASGLHDGLGASAIPASEPCTVSSATKAASTFNFNLPTHGTKTTPTLPGDLSFALRTNITPAEIDLILDADSIHALDFLRLSYTAPPALAAVITPTSVDLYDRVFRHLLRVLRMQFVVGQLWKDVLLQRRGHPLVKRRRGSDNRTTDADDSFNQNSIVVHRFRLEATHFINTISAYTTYTAISQPWESFRAYVSELEEYVAKPSSKPTDVHTPRNRAQQDNFSQTRPHQRTRSPEFTMAGLCSNHDNTLKLITSALFLRKRHRKAATALESACNSILKFAKHVRVHAATIASEPYLEHVVDSNTSSTHPPITTDPDSGSHLRALYEEFRGHATAFSVACAGAEEKDSTRGGVAPSPTEVLAGKLRRELVALLADDTT